MWIGMQLTGRVIGAPRGSRCLNTCGKCYPHIFTAFCLVRWPMAWQNCDKNILAFLSFKLIQILVNWIRKILERHSLAIKTSLCVMLSSCTSNSRKNRLELQCIKRYRIQMFSQKCEAKKKQHTAKFDQKSTLDAGGFARTLHGAVHW